MDARAPHGAPAERPGANVMPAAARPAAVFGPRIAVEEVLSGRRLSPLAAYDAPARAPLTAMARWISEFLTAGDPRLGRAGAVCPYAGQAVEEQMIRLTACASRDEAAIVAGVARLRRELADLANWPAAAAPAHRAIVAVFPLLAVSEGAAMIERIQKRLKPSFVKGRLMIGQFYPSCSEPGLWNPAFRPLQSPVVSLAMRNITIFDAPFMLDRAEYVEAFVDAFGAAGRQMIARARARIRLGLAG